MAFAKSAEIRCSTKRRSTTTTQCPTHGAGGLLSRVVAREGLDVAAIDGIASHFHARYRDNALYRNRMHGQRSARMDAIRKQPFSALSGDDKAFAVALTAYRYRNNIFHGNKVVDSW